uniref:Uncharacterized protein n=1 Tax=Candidatus Kentrum sp. FM TaxID=2126340 RepID=A0A450SJ31_9GAMM|nr:MAG: hypothetical protein BECKFM1743A_GA0114220_101146 [Candidatus Kentron sp. FM]VFJ54592.1 MAG: hypothetical protein BECKFM1743C_GA0114222_101416 [Candidatus Kentron sp. FM]VFK10373.1 MAG: hypothetical protein BECKFM1743B_GA0114221_101386 [Candidatus Kentron sp. FM]
MKELDDLHSAVLDGVRVHFDRKLKTVAAYDIGNTDPCETPAAFLVMESGGRGEDLGDGRFPLRCIGLYRKHSDMHFKTAGCEPTPLGFR